ncbi:MAG TPA: acyltransferase [Acidimicrobiales bacterium]|nr:acyltransferase [Acidimicrobiales bacterium]
MTASAVADGRRVDAFGHVPALEGIRGLAVVLVMAHHYLVGHRGLWVGVDVFFVLSGFLITTGLLGRWSAGRPPRLGRFYAARARRILPMMLVVVVAYVGVVYDRLGIGAAFPLDQILAIPYENVRSAIDGPVNPQMGHLWTIAAEVQFYLVWPLVLLGLLRLRVTSAGLFLGLVMVAVAGAGLRLGLSLQGATWFSLYFSPATRFDGFFLGGAVGVLATHGTLRTSASMAQALRLLSPLAVAAIAWFATVGDVTADLAYRGGLLLATVAAAVLVAAGVAGALGPLRIVVETQPLRLLGRISYSLYLWHLPMLAAVALWVPGKGWDRITAAAVASVLVSSATYLWVERPFLGAAKLPAPAEPEESSVPEAERPPP